MAEQAPGELGTKLDMEVAARFERRRMAELMVACADQGKYDPTNLFQSNQNIKPEA